MATKKWAVLKDPYKEDKAPGAGDGQSGCRTEIELHILNEAKV